MLFRKLYFESTPDSNGKPVESWYMILRTVEDILEYMKIDITLMTEALITIPKCLAKSHLEGGRQAVMNVALETAVMSAKPGEKVYPLDVLQKFCNNKAMSMFKLLRDKGELQVNQAGGYCDHSSFVNLWGCIVVAEIEKEGCYFPTDTEVVASELLFLENSERICPVFSREIYERVGYDWNEWSRKKLKDSKITQLKLRDPEWVGKMIAKSKNIAIQTQLTDDNQLNKFMGLFSQLKDKIIYISTSAINELTMHPLYRVCKKRHQIIFV
jgi:hypothetical protein